MKKQQGITFIGFVFLCIIIVFALTIGAKIAPAYIEFMSVKRAIKTTLSQMNETSTRENVIAKFNELTRTEDIQSVSGSDLRIVESKSGGYEISVDYKVTKPLFANVSALLDFNVDSAP